MTEAPAIREPQLVIDARTARTGGGATVLRMIDEMLVPSLIGIEVVVRRPSDDARSITANPAAPLTWPRRQPEIVLGLSEAGNLGAGGSRSTIMLARNWNCWTPAQTVRRRIRSAVAKSNAKRADIVIVATESFASAMRPLVGSTTTVEVLPFGVGPQFRPEGPTAEGSYYLCVGDWYPWKKFELAVEAFAMIADEVPSASLRIAGRSIHPDYLDATLDRARQLGVADRVEVLGHVDAEQLAALYRGAIATVATSELESFGHPYLEAMASGSPLIGRAMPVTEELVAGHGVLLPGSPEAFARAMLDSSSDEAKQRTASALEYVTRYSWAGYMARLRELIMDGLA